MPGHAQLELILQFGVHAPDAVGAAAVLVDRLYDLREGGVGDVPLRGGPLQMGVVAAPGDLQEPGHQRHGVVRLLSLDEAIGLYRVSRAK